MDSNSLLPYEYSKVDDTFYTFVNRDGIVYNIYFLPLPDFCPQYAITYSLNIEPEEKRPHPMDVRIVLTVIKILRNFFQNDENAMIMVCDNTDGKEKKRRNLFDRWYEQYADESITKYDAAAHKGDYHLFASIYFLQNNPFGNQLRDAFYDLMKQDPFEIVI
ncbi:MAG: hypothetical protein IJ190_10630 [Prevotella sp.]|nr:hypothetical protein [Prevotella sp.]